MSVKASILFCVISSISAMAVAKEVATPEGLEFCTVCHGSQLKGNVNIGAPRLSGLSAEYVERQLLNFKQGIRGAHSADERGNEMRPMVSNLSDEEIAAIASWVSSTDSRPAEATIAGDAAAGKTLYQSCSACHGPAAEGNPLMQAPNLRGLNDWYLVTQLEHFRQGMRGMDSADIYGQQMRAASSLLTNEQDAANVAAYINQLK